MKKFILVFMCAIIGCNKREYSLPNFTKISDISLEIGGAEILCFDKKTKCLFVTNPTKKSVDVLDISNPQNPHLLTSISITEYGGNLNSVDVNNGMLAIAVEGFNHSLEKGSVVLFKTDNLSQPYQIFTVGYLPDMVTFTPNGKYILTANEGEPTDDYSSDPPGSISIIDWSNNMINTLFFDCFESRYQELANQHFRIFGKKSNGQESSFYEDVEPEFITVSDDSKTAWVSLQENNGLAKISIESATIVDIYPLGVKDYSCLDNSSDFSDKDGRIELKNVPVKSFYQPDAIDFFRLNGVGYIALANEGDARDYNGFSEEVRVADLKLDSFAFPNYADLQKEENIGRLKVTNTPGDIDNDGDFDVLYSYGGRSFSIRDEYGGLVYDSNNELMKRSISFGTYPDKRSDDKGVEPESVVAFKSGGKMFLAIGLERSGDVLIYNVDNPEQPIFVQSFFNTSPEGLVVVPASDSPNKKELLIVTNEQTMECQQ